MNKRMLTFTIEKHRIVLQIGVQWQAMVPVASSNDRLHTEAFLVADDDTKLLHRLTYDTIR